MTKTVKTVLLHTYDTPHGPIALSMIPSNDHKDMADLCFHPAHLPAVGEDSGGVFLRVGPLPPMATRNLDTRYGQSLAAEVAETYAGLLADQQQRADEAPR